MLAQGEKEQEKYFKGEVLVIAENEIAAGERRVRLKFT
jgi:hypothetical protein